MKRVYLAGPIHGRTDEDCMDWREEARVLLYADGAANRLGVLDPMRRDYRDQREGQLETMREIIVLDKLDIRTADALLVRFDVPSVGTSMEVFYAHELGKPIALVNASGATLPAWMKYHVTRDFLGLPEACEWLLDILSGY